MPAATNCVAWTCSWSRLGRIQRVYRAVIKFRGRMAGWIARSRTGAGARSLLYRLDEEAEVLKAGA
jgi:hypothetical protein